MAQDTFFESLDMIQVCTARRELLPCFLQNFHAQSLRHGRETLCQAHLYRQHSSSGRVYKKINTSLVFYENFATLATLNKMLLHINNTELK